jgi:hypothetical protein
MVPMLTKLDCGDNTNFSEESIRRINSRTTT